MASEEHCKKRQFGFFKGIVKDRNDPKKQGNLRVFVPTLSKKLFEAMPSHDLLYDFRIPPVGALVWIGFQDGLTDLPIWFWGWNKQGELDIEIRDDYPSNVSLGKRLLKWGDLKIVFTPDENNRKIEIKDENETTSIILAPDDDVSISVRAQGNILIESENGSIIMRSNAVIEETLGNKIITTPDNLKIEAGRAIEVNSVEEFTVTANNLIKLFGATTAEIGLEAGTVEADKRGLNSTATETKIYHALKVLIEAVTNEIKATAENKIEAVNNIIKADATNTIESPQNTLKADVQNVLDASINMIGSSSAIEPLVLGTQLVTMLSAILPLLMTHTHPHPTGPTTPSAELLAGLPSHISNIPNTISKGNFTE